MTAGPVLRTVLRAACGFAVGLALFVITLCLNIVSGLVLRRYREVYQ